MGACYNTMELDGKLSKVEVTAKFDDRCNQDSYESGHCYSGTFSQFEGLRFTDKVFSTGDEANEYLMEYGKKWGPAVAVQYRYAEPSKAVLNHDKARMKLLKKIWVAEDNLRNMKNKARINNRSAEPAYVKNARIKLEQVMVTVQPKVDVLVEKAAAILAELGAKSKDVRWLLGGWCSS